MDLLSYSTEKQLVPLEEEENQFYTKWSQGVRRLDHIYEAVYYLLYSVLHLLISSYFFFLLVQFVALGIDQHVSSQSKPKLVTRSTTSTALMVYKELFVPLNLEVFRYKSTNCSIICQFLKEFSYTWWYLLIRQTVGRLISDWTVPVSACSNWFLNFAGFNYRLSDTICI